MAQDAKPDIADIQRALVKHGYSVGSVDGLWGRRSINALAAFQKAEGLPATGELDRATISRLLQPRQARPPLNPDAGSVPAPGKGSSPVLEKPASLPPPRAEAAKPVAGASSVPPARSAPISSPPAPATDQSRKTAPSSGPGFGWIIGIVASFGIISLLVRRRGDLTRAGSKNSSGAGQLRISRNDHSASAPATSMAKAVPALSDALKSSLVVHNASVGRAIENRKALVPPSDVSPENEEALLRVVKAPAATALANTLADDLKERLAVHNAEVGRAIGGQISSDGSVLSSFDRNVELTAGLKTATANAPPALGDELKAKLSAHNAEVGRAIEGRNSDLASAHQARSSFMERLVVGVRRDEPAPADGWTPAGQTVRIGPHVVGGGMIYVGRRLPQQGSGHQPENCLINPDLAVATRSGDPHGVTMGYWPSYSTISAEARKSYLEWLAGPRSDPGTYIGYVFLYFYGLERRLMLEKGAPDTEAVVVEVRRLLNIYGSHHSFRRYAQELLSAHEMRQALPPQTVVPDAGFAGYEVPLHIKAVRRQHPWHRFEVVI
ncbi:TerB N-terminal domain-containing protein [Xanthobacter sp. ZOL 2024]